MARNVCAKTTGKPPSTKRLGAPSGMSSECFPRTEKGTRGLMQKSSFAPARKATEACRVLINAPSTK